MSTRAASCLLVVLPLLACSSRGQGSEPTTIAPESVVPPTATVTTARPKDVAVARTWPADAPKPDAACNEHSDCWIMMWDAPMPPDPCCDQRVGFMPTTRAYAVWMSQYQKQSCTGVRCPPLPMPGAEPSCCVSIGRCVGHKCVSGCDDPTLDAPKVVWHDAACQSVRMRSDVPSTAAP